MRHSRRASYRQKQESGILFIAAGQVLHVRRGRGIYVSSQTGKRQTGGVGICVSLQTSGEMARGALREIGEIQTDDTLVAGDEETCR